MTASDDAASDATVPDGTPEKHLSSEPTRWREFHVIGPTPFDPNFALVGPGITSALVCKHSPFRTGVYDLLEEMEKSDAANRDRDRIQTALLILDAEMEKVKRALKDGHASAARGFLGAVDIRFTGITDEMWDALVSILNAKPLNSASIHLYEFRREADHWIVAFDGKCSLLADHLGLRYLHMLLGRPDEDVSSTSLADSAGFSASGAGYTRSDLKDEGLSESLGTQGSPIEAITQEELRRLQNHNKWLDEKSEEARDFGNDAEFDRLQEEKEQILSEMKRRTNKFGKPRKIGFQPDRNRINVKKAIGRALAVIRDANPKCFDFLSQEKQLKTGSFCSYRSDPRIDWHL